MALLLGLGIWQVQRLSWKETLITRVDSRVHATPVPVPAEADWPSVNAADDEYLHVTLHGHFLNADEVEVYTVQEAGPGYWVMTPLQLTTARSSSSTEPSCRRTGRRRKPGRAAP